MTLATLIARSYLTATGEVSELVKNDDDWVKLLQIANIKIDEWANEPGVDWRSLYSNVTVGTVTATDTFALPSTIRKLSSDEGDRVRITHTDNKYTDYQIVAAERLKEYASTGTKYCAKVGSNLVFTSAFVATDPQFGGTIKVPAYTYPTLFVTDGSEVGTETIPVDDPNWLVFACAAEYDRTDITKQNLYPNLVAEANNLMAAMKSANNAQVTTVYKAQVSSPNGSTW